MLMCKSRVACMLWFISVISVFATATTLADQQLPPSVLVIDQFEVSSAFSGSLLSSYRATIDRDASRPISTYVENLDLGRFAGSQFETALVNYLRERYKNRPIGVIAAIGTAALEVVLRHRPELRANVPVIFEQSMNGPLNKLTLPPGITGTTVRLDINDAITIARAIVPELRHIAIVGDPPERQFIRTAAMEQLASLKRKASRQSI